MKSTDVKIGIVNSSTFGIYNSDLLHKLKETGSVKRFDFDPDIKGKQLASKLEGFQYVIASVTPSFPESFFETNKSLKLIARHGIGCDNIDLEAATKAGVLITKVSGKFERNAVAEHTIALALTCFRKIIPAQEAVRTDEWERRANFLGKEIFETTAGIIGYGNIGGRVAKILRAGFDAHVLACDPNVSDRRMKDDEVKPTSLEKILHTSDLISLHLSLTEESFHLLDDRAFNKMKRGVIIVNTARGELIDDKALEKALETGKVAAAGLDVTTTEPIKRDNPLLEFENVIIVPHIGAYTDRAIRKMDEKMVEDITRTSRGARPAEIVNREVLHTKNRAGIRDESDSRN